MLESGIIIYLIMVNNNEEPQVFWSLFKSIFQLT